MLHAWFKQKAHCSLWSALTVLKLIARDRRTKLIAVIVAPACGKLPRPPSALQSQRWRGENEERRQVASWGCSYAPPPQQAWSTEILRSRRQGDCCCCQLCPVQSFPTCRTQCDSIAFSSLLAHPGSKHNTLLRLRWREKWMRLKSLGYHIPFKHEHWPWDIMQHTHISAHHPCLAPSKWQILSRYLSHQQKSKPALPENFFPRQKLFAHLETSM